MESHPITASKNTYNYTTINCIEILKYASLSCSGGLLGAYSIEMGNRIFANAQTNNLISIAWAITTLDFKDIMLRLLALFLFVLGISLTMVLPLRHNMNAVQWERICLVIEIFCVSLLSILPISLPNILYLSPLFLAASLQYNTFKFCNHVAVSTLFTTNNLRQMVISFWNYRFTKERQELYKLQIYCIITISFILGCCICFLVISKLQQCTPLISTFILVSNYLFLFFYKSKNNNSTAATNN